jgi:high-affinity iron transporter
MEGAQISGVVRMPEICSPTVSPAVVYLTRISRDGTDSRPGSAGVGPAGGQSRVADLVLVDQRGLQFVPRVQAIGLGRTVRFTNQDGETHNVHIVSPDFAFNQSMTPGEPRDFTPEHAGVMRLACDIHHHMRGFVVVSPTPWAQVCDREGRFRLEGVPAGHYELNVWHEMGDSLHSELDVVEGKNIELPPLVLSVPVGPVNAERGNASQSLAPVRPWSDVVDRIVLTLAASRDAAAHSGEAAKARRLADDAYWVEFEASDLETAVRRYLGYGRAGDLERQFRAIRTAVGEVAAKRQSLSTLAESCDRLLVDLVAATKELNAKGVTDRSRSDAMVGAAAVVDSSDAIPDGDPKLLLLALKRGFQSVDQAAQRDGPDAAASELTTVYMTDFEPLERYLLGRSPQDVQPLEIEFHTLRGDLFGGLKGEQLAARLDDLSTQVESVVTRLEAQPAGRFGPAFLASFITIVREGVEVILILTMLLALVGKATSTSGLKARPGTNWGTLNDGDGALADLEQAALRLKKRSVRAIWWGVALAALASVATAIALNVLIVSAAGAAREILEGAVMLAAAGVLFYVSYWLISRFEARRWTDYLAQRARRGIELGGQGTLALTAFLAVYREGAETSLLYQALLGSEGRTRAGLLGLAAGIALGALLLAIIAVILRATSVRLPMPLFFKLSGLFLFLMAIVFAGNGVFELQNAGILVTTNLAWMGRGLPWAGLFPNVQVISVQGMLLGGAILAWLLIPRSALGTGAPGSSGMKLAAKRG